MAGPELGFDGGDLLAAAVDSCGRLPAFLGDLLERAPVAVEGSFLAGQRLISLDYDVDILRVEFDSDADALGQFCRRQRGATSQERIVDQLASLEVVQDRAPHQFDRLLSWVVKFRLVGAARSE